MSQGAEKLSLKGCFLKASLLPTIVVAAVLLTQPKFLSVLFSYPWHLIFALGIVASLYTQLAVHYYFKDIGKYHRLTVFSSWFEDIIEDIFPFVTALLVYIALFNINVFTMHITCTLIYLFFMAGMDALIWLRARGVEDLEETDRRKVQDFKENCRQLCLRVDGAVFAVILVWVLLLSLMDSIDQNGWKFYFAREVKAGVVQGTGHFLRDPLLAGVIGCHMFLSIILIVVHWCEWRREIHIP